ARSARTLGRADRDDAAVGKQGDAETGRHRIRRAEIDGRGAAAVERRVTRAVRVEPHDSGALDRSADIEHRGADRDDLAVGLQDAADGLVIATADGPQVEGNGGPAVAA